MEGPSFWMQVSQPVVAGGPNLRSDARHVQDPILVEVIVKVRLSMEESKTRLGRDAPRVVELGLRPATAPGPQLQGSLTEILLQILERALHVEKLDNRW